MTLARNLADLGNQVDSSGTLGIGGGGTSATTANAGFNALAPNQTSNTNKYLTTNGTNTSWADVVSGMTVTSLSYSGDDQAVDPSNPLPCTLTGTNFAEGSIVYVNTISAANSGTSINVTSSTSITFTPPSGLSAASYNVWIVSPTGTIAILANGILYSGAPSWAGQSTSLSSGASVSIQLTATGDTPLTYSLVSGTLPTGTTLSSSGLISGTASTAGTFPNIVVKATDPQQQDASVTIEITITVADAYFPYVTMLLHGDGANGVQNNTFVDSSTNNFTITRNGNTTQGSFSPYGSNWGNYFDGTVSNSRITFASSTVIPTSTSATWTAECWINPTNTGSSGVIWGQATTASGDNGRTNLSINSSGIITYSVAETGIVISSPTGVTFGQWTHVAVTANASNYVLYINGVSVASGYNAHSIQSGTFRVGALWDGDGTGYVPFKGYVSNLRVVHSVVYTSNFTPSTVPLTAISGTSLLTCQSNRFIDNSSNNFTVTIGGSPSVQRFSPFSPTASYDTATIGGSGYFDGSGDYLSFASNTAFAWGTGAYTVEFWVYLPVFNGANDRIYDAGAANGSFGVQINSDGSVAITRYGFADPLTSSTGAVILNAWNHIAVVRSGTGSNQTVIYVNGVAKATGTDSNNWTVTTNPSINGSGIGEIKGYFSDFRLVKGSAVYTSAFTPPTAPLSAISNTSLLLKTINAGIPDYAMMNDLETVGNAQVSTSVVKYGTGSISFDGTGDYLKAVQNDIYAFNTSNFTVEYWVYLNATGSYQAVFSSRTNSSVVGAFIGFETGTAKPVIYNNNSQVVISSSSISLTTWTHIAFVRNNGTTKVYINGNSTGSASDNNNYVANNGTIGFDRQDNNFPLNGYIDDLRITKGYARYTANFTPPTSAFPSY